jgi:hypothetical protein
VQHDSERGRKVAGQLLHELLQALDPTGRGTDRKQFSAASERRHPIESGGRTRMRGPIADQFSDCVNLREQRALLDHRPVVHDFAVAAHSEGAHTPGDLGADIHDFERLNGARGSDRGRDVAAPHRRGGEGQSWAVVRAPPPCANYNGENRDDNPRGGFIKRKPFFHSVKLPKTLG